MDVLDLAANRFASLPLEEVTRRAPGRAARAVRDAARGRPPVLTFDRLLSATPFVEDLREILRTLADAYRYPVDVEFTLNVLSGGRLRLNVVQCRPLQVKEGGTIAPPPADLPPGAVSSRAGGRWSGRARTRRWTGWCSSIPTRTSGSRRRTGTRWRGSSGG